MKPAVFSCIMEPKGRDSVNKTGILFVCHGNICRSPMAEFVFKDMVRRLGREDEFFISSAATSDEEIGSDIHSGTRRILVNNGIPFSPRRARRLTREDGEKFDLIVGMDRANINNIKRICGVSAENKARLLLSFADLSRDVADPWYTGDFDTAYRDILKGCEGLLKEILS